MRLVRRTLLAAAFLPLLAAGTARAATEHAYDPAAFAAAQAARKPILVEITAPWCPTCAQQKPILERLTATPAFRDLVIFKVDFDHQKDVVRAMGARMQSTLIVFAGATEKGRSVGDTNEASIAALLDQTKG